MFTIRRYMKVLLAIVLTTLFALRSFFVLEGLAIGDERNLLAFPLSVILPTLLISIMLLMPGAKTREGLLMRFGTIVQLLLIVGLPSFALYLALGFPFVFLVVELFETRFPEALRDQVSKLVLA